MSTQSFFLVSSSYKSSSPIPSVEHAILSRDKNFGYVLRNLRCNSAANHSGTRQGRTKNKKCSFEQYKDVFQTDNVPLIKWPHYKHDLKIDDDNLYVPSHHLKMDEIKERVETIKSILRSLSDGEISISPYDTAWVALVKDINGNPQFPSSVEWIANNQLEDGSWGDNELFVAHDRIINTLACVIALTTWNIHSHKCDRGMEFIRENLSKIGEEEDEHMPIGFEVVFPSLIEIARGLGIQLLDDYGVLHHIYAQRNIKLQRIPKEILHNKPTTLLHSLEGMTGLEWEKIMKLQSKDGSLLFSPASTAFALIQTNNLNCFKYLKNIVSKFNGGVPNVYPIDLFEHIWIVDRFLRLGISRFFKDEIKECMEYIYKYWTQQGICWARNSEVQDIDDTAMGFRLLRLYGYNVSQGVFKNFKKKGEFFCFDGQSSQAVTGMYNLFRASQLQFPSEEILDEARVFSSNYLTQKQACNQLLDKWIIMKDLPGEVGYALRLPWYANLPRIETRFYIEQYGGDDDVWIGKTLYRMPYVNNNTYLELAKLDFNTCQTLHLNEWASITSATCRWFVDNKLKEYGLSQTKLLQLYFVSLASIFEPERSIQRLAWAKTAAILEAIETHSTRHKDPSMQRQVFADEFFRSLDLSTNTNESKGLLGSLESTLRQLSMNVMTSYGVDIYDNLLQGWKRWIMSWVKTGDRYTGEAELLTRTIQACTNPKGAKLMGEEDYHDLVDITNKICQQLGNLRANMHTKQDVQLSVVIPKEVDAEMQRLAEMVFSQNHMDINIKLTFWEIARSYYYTAYCSPTTINSHLIKVMFQIV